MLAGTSLAELRSFLVDRFPELASARFTLLTQGFDSIAVDVDDRLIFKFPRDEDAARRLQKESRLLAVIRPRVSLPVPDLVFVAGPPPFSRHTKLLGRHLLDAEYAMLPEDARDDLARNMARFYAELHALDRHAMAEAGAEALEPWSPSEEILRQVWPVLPQTMRALAERTFAARENLSPDPLGTTYGFFDGHGWNMAFDHARQRLNGMYDFADSGFGPLHQEFIYTGFISLDLTRRIADEYERLAECTLDRERIHLLTGVFWLSELGGYAHDEHWRAFALRYVETWARFSSTTLLISAQTS